MRNKQSIPLGPPRVQFAVAVEITDPVEIAAIERMRKRLKRKGRNQNANSARNGVGANTRKAVKKGK
jgi:hypothetical protein